MTARLGVNVDHVATIRQARKATYPDPVTAAALAELAGAEQITIHLREDRRHIQERDLRVLRATVSTLLNLEMAAIPEMVKIAYETKPDLVTLVPERREELTTEGGLDLTVQRETILKVIKSLRDAEITTSVFIAPDVDQIKAAHRAGAERVELHTGRYAGSATLEERKEAVARLVDAAKFATKLGLGCAAGHGLDYDNVRAIAQVPEIDELNIGHAIVARAVLVGFDRAVRDMLAILRNP